MTAKPHKAQVTMRFNEEVQWADEDYQVGRCRSSPRRNPGSFALFYLAVTSHSAVYRRGSAAGITTWPRPRRVLSMARAPKSTR